MWYGKGEDDLQKHEKDKLELLHEIRENALASGREVSNKLEAEYEDLLLRCPISERPNRRGHI